MKTKKKMFHKGIPRIGYDLVLVKWVDSRQAHGWVGFDEFENKPVHVYSIGWKMLENEECISITAHYGGPPQPQCCGEMLIPKCSIKRMITLVKDDRKK